MKRVCLKCGKIFYSNDGDSILCSVCKKEKLKNDVARQRVCIDCGRIFDGGPRALRCPNCRIIANQKALKKYKKNGALRPIGSIDICQRCGKEYIVNSSRQKFCSDLCSKEALLEWQREHQKATRDPEKSKVAHIVLRSKRQKICKYCLSSFWSSKSSELCSDYCRKKQKQINQCKADIDRGHKRNMQRYIDEREKYRIEKAKDNNI